QHDQGSITSRVTPPAPAPRRKLGHVFGKARDLGWHERVSRFLPWPEAHANCTRVARQLLNKPVRRPQDSIRAKRLTLESTLMLLTFVHAIAGQRRARTRPGQATRGKSNADLGCLPPALLLLERQQSWKRIERHRATSPGLGERVRNRPGCVSHAST